jgi:hypothetical protein
VQEVLDASAQGVDKVARAFERVAGQIDYDFGIEGGDFASEGSLRFFGRAIQFGEFDPLPGFVLDVWLALGSAHADHAVSGLRQ